VTWLVRGLVLALSLGACSTSTDTKEGPPTFSAIYPMLFPRPTHYQCDFCHGLPPNDKSNGRLSTGMDAETAYAGMIGQPSTSSKCGEGYTIVVPGDPDNSLLLMKLSANPPCGDQMPNGGDKLSSTQLDQVRMWILDGAMND